MEYEDRLAIATPEGVDLELPLAGVGSRFVAQLVDALLKLIVIGALALALALIGGGAVAVFTVAFFLVLYGYDVLFETFASGRTPGKRWSGLRVIRADGRPVGFRSSAVRNIVRLFDGLLTAYIAGVVSILVSPRNQRLGDIAAGTIVVREPRPPRRSKHPAKPGDQAAPAPGTEADRRWDVAAVTASDMAAIRQFLERREGLPDRARAELADDLAKAMRAKVAGAPAALAGELFLERLAARKGR